MLRYRDGLVAFAFLTAAGIIAVAMIVDPKGFSIKDWQTLLAAFVAVGAATLAYRSAMAKIDFDRDAAKAVVDQKRLGLMLRVRFSLQKFVGEAMSARRIMTNPPLGGVHPPPESIQLNDVEVLAEAWENLDLLPGDVAYFIDLVRSDLPHARKRLASFPALTPIPIPTMGVQGNHPLMLYLKYVDTFASVGEHAMAILNQEIMKIKAAALPRH